MKVVLEKRLEQSLKAQIGLPVLSALMALVFCGVFFALTGKDPLLVYESMFRFWYMRACSAARWATITAFRKLS